MIGIGILTYKRPEHYADLLESLRDAGVLGDDRYTVMVQKDGGGSEFCARAKFIHKQQNHNDNFRITDYHYNLGIGRLKATALETLKERCEHIFLIEDDVVIKSADIFERYIEVSEKFNTPHLMWSQADKYNPLKLKIHDIGFYEECRGVFTYFCREALYHKIDLEYHNALEHVDHYYSMQLHGIVPPLYWFPDVVNSSDYIENNPRGTQTSIVKDAEYNKNLTDAFNYWESKWGLSFRDYIKRDRNNTDTVIKFMKERYDKHNL